MAVVGQVVPEGVQSKEGFHALRRTTEGLLYYTKVNKDDTDTLDFEGGSPTCLLYTSPSPRDVEESRMPSSA